MDKNKIIRILFCLLFLLLIAGNIFNYQTIYKQSFELKNFDSKKDAPIVLYENTNDIENAKLDKIDNLIKNLAISFDFKINAVNQWDNLFQTSDYNNGIRMELDKTNHAALIIKSTGETGLQGIPIQKFDNNVWYHVKIIKKPNDLPQVFINSKRTHGDIEASAERKETTKTDEFQVDNIIVGRGFDKNRTFNGQIKNFKYYFSAKKHNQIIENCFSIISYCILLLLIILSVLNIKEEYQTNKDNNIFHIKNLLFLLLFNLYPIAFSYLSNINELMFIEFLELGLISSVIISLIYAILYKFVRADKLYIILLIFIASFYLTGHIYNKFFLFCPIEQYLKMIISLCVIVITGCILSKKQFESFIKVSKFIITILLALAILSNFSLIWHHFKRIATEIKTKKAIAKENVENAKEIKDYINKKPNIYFIILDGYINSQAAYKYYNFDNSQFIKTLRSKGFYVADYGISNYGHTKFSVPSMLNFNYLENLGIKPDNKAISINDKLNSLYINNKLTTDFISNKYNLYYINLENAIARNFNEKYVYKTFLPPDNTSEYTLKNMVLQNSFLFFNTNNFGLAHRTNVYAAFDYIKECSNNKTSNKFIFAHILTPHFPYIFDEKGNLPEPKAREELIINTNKNTYAPNSTSYLKQIKYVNNLAIDLFDTINKSDKEAVVIFISDHGYVPQKDYPLSKPVFAFFNDDDYYVRAGNLEAIYFPDGDYSMLYDSITPVNLVRVLLNKYFDAKLPLIEDKHYYSETYVKYEPIDVTQKVKKQLTEDK